jgi:putative acetyltransferase
MLSRESMMSRSDLIRPERSGDAEGIHAVHARCFPTGAEARLVGLLREAGRLSVSLVAEVDGTLVGHVAFSSVSTATGATGVEMVT